MVFMIADLPDYLARKVTKLPFPADLDDAIARTWLAFCTCPPHLQPLTYAPMAWPVAPGQPQMDLDTLRAMPHSAPP